MGVTLDPEHIIDATGRPAAGRRARPRRCHARRRHGRHRQGIALGELRHQLLGGHRRRRECGDDEVDTFDVAIFDRATGAGVLVVTDEDPDWCR